MQAGLRRNDDGVADKFRRLYIFINIPVCAIILACHRKAEMTTEVTTDTSSFRRRPESSGFNHPFPRKRG